MVAIWREAGNSCYYPSRPGQYLPDGRWIPTQPWENRPDLPFDDTIRLLNAIPERKWKVPKQHWGSYSFYSTETEVQGHADRMISDWVNFLNRAEKGMKAVQEGLRTNTIILGGDTTIRLRYFFNATKKLGITGDENQVNFLDSARRGLSALLSAEARKELGVIDQQPVSVINITDAKRFVATTSEGNSSQRLQL